MDADTTSPNQSSSSAEYSRSASSSRDMAARVYQAASRSQLPDKALGRILPPTVVIAGPTGIGKTALSLDVAQRFDAEIISADSRQVYRGFDIGTAKVTLEERARAPHHLIDVVAPTETYSAARFRDDALAALAGIRERRRLALIVGGTGHYIQALIENLDVPRVEPDWELRAALEQEAARSGPAPLHRRLEAADPDAAARIPPANVRRVIRALEVIAKTGQQFSALSRRRGEPRSALRLALRMERRRLYQLVDERVDSMIARGWLDEVRGLLDAGVSLTSPAMYSSGYRELAAALHGELPLAEAIQRAKYSVHAYIRRQDIWLRRQPGFEWIDVRPGYQADVAERAARYLLDSIRTLEDT